MLLLKKAALAAALFAGGAGIAPAQADSASILQQIKTVFVIALENHNWTQACPDCSSAANSWQSRRALPQQPGHARQPERGAGFLRHEVLQRRSERASVRAELHLVGSRDGLRGLYGRDPSTDSGNLFTAQHLTGQMTRRAFPGNLIRKTWNTPHPLPSAVPERVRAAPISTTAQPNMIIASKHNPMEFFTDTQNRTSIP